MNPRNPTMTTLTFLQHLLIMEALDQLTTTIRTTVAAGDTTNQQTLTELEDIQHLIDEGTITITTKEEENK
jgi:hypothetical protein